MTRDIFISYSRKDLDKVKIIKEELEKNTGAECWMDLNAIESGATQFTQKIVEGIKTCRIFLFMLTKESQASKFALRELNFAMKKVESDKQKHVVIVNVDGCEMCDEFDFMYGLTDTITWNDVPQRNKLIRDVMKWLGGAERNTKDNAVERVDISTNRGKDEVELYRVNQGGRYGFKDKTGKIVIPCQWKDVGNFSEGLASVKNRQLKWGFIDKMGNEVIPCQWKQVGFFHEGMAAVTNDNFSTGFIDKSGKVVCPCQWLAVGYFSEGLAPVMEMGRTQMCFGYIDKTGKVVIPYRWKEAEPFHDGIAHVKDNNGKLWKIDKTGTVVGEAM